MIGVDSIKYFELADFVFAVSDELIKKSTDLVAGLEKFSIKKPMLIDFFLGTGDKMPNNNEKKLLCGISECTYPTFVYRFNSGDYEFQFQQPNGKSGLTFYISKEWSNIILLEDDTDDNGYMFFNRLGALINLAVLNYNACVFHGVVMEYQGDGILVMASAGTGKTTHTDMWENREKALIINGDRCLCRCIDGVWYAFGMPWAGSSGKILNRKVQIQTIVMLERNQNNYVERISPFKAELYLLQRMFAPVSKGELQEKAFEYAHDITVKISVLSLMCRPDYESVDVLKKAIQDQQVDKRRNYEIF